MTHWTVQETILLQGQNCRRDDNIPMALFRPGLRCRFKNESHLCQVFVQYDG